MILAIDAGNTRVKWGLAESVGVAAVWRALGSATLDELDRLDADLAGIPRPEKIAVANVAGEPVRARLAGILERFAMAPTWLRAVAEATGVTNGYDDPSQLGVDRWASIVAAWHRRRAATLVVSAGTATTADLLSAEGRFEGGVILPGLDLMKRSLAEHTAGLPLAMGEHREAPHNTADAIETGCLDAQAGAIERLYARLPEGAGCLVSGGAAGRIVPFLAMPAEIVEHLALEGVARLAP